MKRIKPQGTTYRHRITGETVTVTGRVNSIVIFDSEDETGEELLDYVFAEQYEQVTSAPVGAAEAEAFAAKAQAKATAEWLGLAAEPADDYSTHTLFLHRTLTTSVDVVADAEGNAQIVESGGENIIEHIDSHLVCEECGSLYTDELLAAHGFSDEWNEV